MQARARYGRYVLVEPLGRGGMSEVWLARHVDHGRRVALKMLKVELLTERARQVFEREARNLSKLQSPHTVRLIDSGIGTQGEPFIVTEYLEGRDLWTRIEADGPLPWMTVIDLGVQLLAALGEAHAAGIVHRDLKPTNVFLEAGTGGQPVAKILDFGLSKLIDPAAEPDADSLLPGLKGSPRYMAPEQIHDGLTSTALDIYGMGALLYCALAGEPPFDGALEDVLVAHRYELPRTLTERGVELPAALDALILRCLHKNPEVRPASAEVLAAMLERVQRDALAEQPARTIPPPAGTPQPRVSTAPDASPAPVSTAPAEAAADAPPELTLVERPVRKSQTVQPEPMPVDPRFAEVDEPQTPRERLEAFFDEMTPVVRYSIAGFFILMVGLFVWRQVRDEMPEEAPEAPVAVVTAPPTVPAGPVRRKMLASVAPVKRAAFVQLRTGRAVTFKQAEGETVYCESATVCWVPVSGDVELRVRRKRLRVLTADALRKHQGRTWRVGL